MRQSNQYKKKIERLEIATDQRRGADDKWRSAYDVLEDKINEISEYSKMGYDVSLDLAKKDSCLMYILEEI